MQHDTNQTPPPGFLILEQVAPSCAAERRKFDIIHNGWTDLRGPATSESAQAQAPDIDALSNLSPISPASTLYDTEGSLTDFSVDSDTEDAAAAFIKGGKVVRAAAPGPLPRLDTSHHTIDTEIPQGVWAPLTTESTSCVGYFAQVSIYRPETGKWLTPLALHIDTGGRNTWGLGQGYRVRDRETGHVRLASQAPASELRSRPFRTKITKERINYEPADIITGCERYADGSYVSMFMAYKEPEIFRLSQWYQYSEEHSWSSPLSGSYHFGVADEVDMNIHRLRFDGAIGMGLQPHQYAFARSNINVRHIPSFITAIKNALPLVDTEGGYVLYFSLKLKDIPGGVPNNGPGGMLASKSWLSINNWPCAAVPNWSPRIPLCSTDVKINEFLWKVELISITCGPSDKSQPQFRFVFPNGPIHILFDTGSSGSWFPSVFIRYLRTTVFPFPQNFKIDAEHGDSSSIKDPERRADYFIPETIDTTEWTVDLEFKGLDGKPLVVHCQAYPFLGSESTGEVVKTGLKEGALFTAPAERSRFILGANFFQSMLVALHAPEFCNPYVRVASPQANTDDGFFVPPPIHYGMRM